MPRTKRYKYVWHPNHALANSNGKVGDHRVVLYDKIGPGQHPCHWCGLEVEWRVGNRAATRAGMLMVDHLDANPRNNDPDNLVPSCNRCNQARGPRAIAAAEPFILRANGFRTRAEWRTCQVCGERFLHPMSAAPHTGRFCSLTCKGKGDPRRIPEDEPYLVQPNGKRVRAEWRICRGCSQRFLHRIADKRPNAGQACSRGCANRVRALEVRGNG